jgi:hypothetical protein
MFCSIVISPFSPILVSSFSPEKGSTILLDRRPGKLISCPSLFEDEWDEEVASSASPPDISSKIVFYEVKVPLLRPAILKESCIIPPLPEIPN